MNIANFEKCLDDIILERGFNYYEDGHIQKIVEKNTNYYEVQIQGSHLYTVHVLFDYTGEILDTACDCPYDWGPYCKHQAAAFFALKDDLKHRKRGEEAADLNGSPPKSTEIKTLLSDLTKKDLVEIILEVCNDYPEVEQTIFYQYASPADDLTSSKELIIEYIRAYSDRGFISWEDASDAIKGAKLVLEKTEQKIAAGETKSAVYHAILVFSQLVDMLEYTDDSGGYVGMVIDRSLELIEEAIAKGIDHLDDFEQENLFLALMNESEHSRLEGWSEWRYSFYRFCIYFCKNHQRRKALEEQLQNIEQQLNENSWFYFYKIEKIRLLQLAIITHVDGEEKAIQYIYKNLEFPDIREKAIEYALGKGEYHEVLRLCKEGEKRNSNKKWQVYQLKAYEGLGDLEKTREILFALLKQGAFEYYPQLKETYHSDEWSFVLKKLMDDFEKRSTLPYIYLQIAKEELLPERILKYCKENIGNITDLSSYLVDDYFQDVVEIYKNHIRNEAKYSSNRNQYRKVCFLIIEFKKACGTEYAEAMIEELKEKYKRRSAFLDELSKIK